MSYARRVSSPFEKEANASVHRPGEAELYRYIGIMKGYRLSLGSSAQGGDTREHSV